MGTWQKHLGFSPQGVSKGTHLRPRGESWAHPYPQHPAKATGPEPALREPLAQDRPRGRGGGGQSRPGCRPLRLPGGPGGPRGPGTPASTVSTAAEASCECPSVGRAEGPVTRWGRADRAGVPGLSSPGARRTGAPTPPGLTAAQVSRRSDSHGGQVKGQGKPGGLHITHKLLPEHSRPFGVWPCPTHLPRLQASPLLPTPFHRPVLMHLTGSLLRGLLQEALRAEPSEPQEPGLPLQGPSLGLGQR